MDWRNLTEELDAWTVAGRHATLWWRDDDAVEPGPALDRLLVLASERGLPLALAVIPARASEALVEALDANPARTTPLQHGYAHRNHAPATEKKAELGAHRPANAVLEQLMRGHGRMAALFGDAWVPILVPPWNRVAAPLIPALAGHGFEGLSTHGPRAAEVPAPGLVQVNTHLDVMRWSAPRGFLGEGEALEILVGQLRARRLGEVDAEEPTGLLSHHAAHDEAAWRFLAVLLDRLSRHPVVRFLDSGEAFAKPGTTGGSHESACQGAA